MLGVTGSIAAIETPRIVRELIRHGAEVRAVLSPEASRIVSEEALAFATGHPTISRLTGDVEHVTLLGPGEGRADLLLIAPATANTIAKIAHGIDDTPVTSCASVALGGGVPILLAPAMHAHMGQNPAVRASLEQLVAWGVGIVQPEAAEGEEKLASPEEVAAAVLHRLASGPWVGRHVIVIGGASRESIDDVRSVTNESSGETAVQLATQAHFRGASVELWAGALQVPVPGSSPRGPGGASGTCGPSSRRRRSPSRRPTPSWCPPPSRTSRSTAGPARSRPEGPTSSDSSCGPPRRSSPNSGAPSPPRTGSSGSSWNPAETPPRSRPRPGGR